MLTRSKAKPAALVTEIPQLAEPKSYNQSKYDPNWIDAMNKEYAALLANHTWILVPPNDDQNIVRCKWVYKVKRRADGSLERYKACLVAKGFHQEGIDFFKPFSPVVRPTTIRVVLTLVISYAGRFNN